MSNISAKNMTEMIPEILPIVPTMDVVVFPQMIVPLLVLDERIIAGIQKSLEESKLILLLASKKQMDDYHGAIGTQDLYEIGTVASIMRLIKIPEGGIKILVQGVCKAHTSTIITEDNMLTAHIEPISQDTNTDSPEIEAQIKNIKQLVEKMDANGHSFSPDFCSILSKMHDPQKIGDFILSHLNINVREAQELLEAETVLEFLEGLYCLLERELEVVEIQERVKNHARESMNKSQKEFYLREQLKAIKKELGEDELEDIDVMRDKLETISMPDDARKEATRQINRLERTAADSMEAAVIRNYLDWIFSLPWDKETEDNLDIKHAKEILDADHYGLKDIKERILDFISVKNLRQDGSSPIVCFVGPPGTGKTSLGQSIAKCLGREYFRVSLGGVKDEAEIRGHRRTYVGAMPGRFIQGFRKVSSKNPVMIIDELDKIGQDFRGDPSAALLEVLDPQQNKTFYDNYLGVPFDLSKVMFVATANSLDTISEPLRDRMEIIHLSGYTLDEKKSICKLYLVDRAIQEAGLEKHNIIFPDEVIDDLITNYTRESGVRQLNRVVSTLCSKAARSIVENNKLAKFTPKNLEEFLGPRKFASDDMSLENQIGVTNGLAWTSCGGDMLKIEAVIMPGRGKLILTGHLGNVMKESAQAAVSYARAHAKTFGIAAKMFTHYDLHIHVPAGGIPKDGPSAGITMLTSILSALTNRPINGRYAMTGELNLHGEVMPIGGVKEKVLAAKRNKIEHVIFPLKNKTDFVGLEDIAKDIDIIWVNHADEVLKHVLLDMPLKKFKNKQ
ncbi:MAG: endopeptidase La [Candidatus Babeliales bacterium]